MTATNNLLVGEITRMVEELADAADQRDRYKAALRRVPEEDDTGRCYGCEAKRGRPWKVEPHASDCAWQEANR